MAYTKTNWVNGQTPINESNLNKIENGIYNNDAHIGDLNDLETDDKTNLVEAINEATAHIGDLNDLETDDKTNLVEAINEATTKGGGVPAGTIVDYDGSTVPDGWQAAAEEEVTLYENASGTTGNITFSQSLENFRFLEIHYGGSGLSTISVSKFKVGSTKINLQLFVATTNTLYLRYTNYSLSNTAMSVDQVFNYDIYKYNSSINPQSTDNVCYITKVIGIR